MKWIAAINNPRHLRLVIEQEYLRDIKTHEQVVWYYIYIYENDNKRPTWDYVQSTLEIAKQFAFKQFQVPSDAWKPVP